MNNLLSQIAPSNLMLLLLLAPYFSLISDTATTKSVLNSAGDPPGVQLTPTEKQWITEHPEVKFTGDPNWLPYKAFREDGTYIGMVADHLRLIEEKSGLRFRPIPVSSWTESLRIATEGKVSVISGDAADAILNRHFNPVDTYSRNPIVIIMRSRQNYVEQLEEIKGRKIAIIKDYGYTADIFRSYPGFKFIEVENIQEGLEGVSQERFDAMLATMSLASYHIAEMGIHNVKVVGKTPIIMDLTLFVSKQQPLLHSVIDKTLKSIDRAESLDIVQSWIRSKYVEKTDYHLVVEIGIGLMIVVAIILVWNGRLRREIETRQRVEAELRHSEEVHRAIIETSRDWIWELDLEGRHTYSNPAVEAILGYTAYELIGGHNLDLIHENEKERVKDNYEGWIREKQGWSNFVIRWHHKNGGYRYLESNAVPSISADGKLMGFRGVDRDITDRKEAEEALRESEEKLRNIVEYSTNLFYSHTPDHVLTYMSPRTRDLLDCEPKEAMIHWTEFVTNNPINEKGFLLTQKAIETGVKQSPYELELIGKKGRKILVEVNEAPVRCVEKTVAIVGALTDITERKQAEEALKESIVSQKAILAVVPDLMFELDDEGRYLDLWALNPNELAANKERLLGRTVSEILPAGAADQVMTALKEAGEKGQSYGQQIQLTTPGGELWFELSTSLKDGEALPHRFIMLSRNITDRKHMEEKLTYLSDHDSLTGLYNRRILEQRLNDEINRMDRYSHVLSVFMMDLDHFKRINDTYGHRVGDEVLLGYAKLLENCIRKTDYAARYGGEEFVVILPETSLLDARDLAERLRLQVADYPIIIEDDKEIRITVSIGVASFPEHAQSTINLLGAADSAMYAAKEAGRNKVKIPER